MEINIMKVSLEEDGLYTMERLMHQKYLIENDHDLKKYQWQKEHLPNQTGSNNSYHPKKYNNAIKKKYKTWKN